MKLTKENIQFIDTYLINSNVIYVDIRYEMIDHIATAVEEKMNNEKIDFYDAFKNYMVSNKNEILKINKEANSISWIEVKKFLNYLIKPFMIFVALVLLFVYNYVDINSYFSEAFTFSNLVFIVYISILTFQLGYYKLFLKKKYYGIEKTGQILIIIYFLFPFFNNNNLLISVLFLFILIGYVFYFFNEISKFNKYEFQLD